jgi:hypothetical protein
MGLKRRGKIMIEININDMTIKTQESKVDSIQLIINGVTYYSYWEGGGANNPFLPDFKIIEGKDHE